MIYLIKNWISSVKRRLVNLFFEKLGKHKLLWKKRTDVAIFELLEAYLTEKVLKGEEKRRQELVTMQRKIDETKAFIDFVKKT